MRGFEANSCRLCQKVFCCEKCRVKHEKIIHKIFPGCDICVYGKYFFENVDNNFLQHLESSHLPVHCVYCKKVFGSIEELLQHKKCTYSQTKENSPKTPFKATTATLITVDNDSPILQEAQREELLNYILATSTPMNRGEEPNLIFEKSNKEVITPVDKPFRVVNKSIIKKTDSVKSEEQLSKRRVTFGETPSNNPSERNMGGNLTEDQEVKSVKVSESSDNEPLNQKSSENFTPVAGSSTGPFYSAHTETDQFHSAKTDIPLKSEKDDGCIKNLPEGYTPVGIPNKSKLINIKGDIYKNQDEQINSPWGNVHFETEESINQDNFNLESMELCTPARTVHPSENGTDAYYQESEQIDTPPLVENEHRDTKNAMDIYTPAKPSNTGKITVKGDIYKNSEQHNISPQTEGIIENDKTDETNKDNQNKSEDNLDNKEVLNTTGHDTLWLSAVNLEKTDYMEQQTDENKEPDENNQPTQENISILDTQGSSPRKNQRRVSIVMPTPILKTTNVQMKFHFPAHLSSTPIVSSGVIKLKQTKIVKDISSRVLQQQTPYKTPQGKLCELVQRKLVDTNLRRSLATLSTTEAGAPKNINEVSSSSDTVSCKDVVHKPTEEDYEDTYSSISPHKSETGISVSSMTESNLWSSMTRIVKSVLGGFTNISQESENTPFKNMSSSFKRQLSDSETGDFLEAPRPKRFRFTDIKCRRTIRELPTLDLYSMPRSLPAPAPSLASIEIVKSVSTVYGAQTIRIQRDKATQTDNYLMYGWHPYS